MTTPAHGFMILLRFLAIFGMGIPASIFVVPGLWAAWHERQSRRRSHATQWHLVWMLVVFLTAYMLVTMRTVRPIFSDNLLLLIIPQALLLSAIGAGWLYDRLRLPIMPSSSSPVSRLLA